MGTHAFDTPPAHCDAYRAAGFDDLPPLFGVEQRWNMLASRHQRAFRKSATFAGVDHYVLTHHFGGPEARRLDDARTWPTALSGTTSLQAPGSPATIASSGVVDYGHLYFRQSLVCEVADEAKLSADAEPSDFFALYDPTLTADVSGYIRRATDAEDPASVLEMDSRAYLVTLSLVRLMRRRRLTGPVLAPVDGRADLRPALEMIEDRLAEPLRLSDLAEAVQMSPYHFSRVFKASTGEAPSAYLGRRRVEMAIVLVRKTDIALAEIAYRTGFSSQSHMHRRIKAATGQTPGRLREQG